MSSLKKLSDYEPLTTPEVIDGIELYAIVNGKTVRVSKANLFSADRTTLNNVKKELNNTITNQIKTVNTTITNLQKTVTNNRALEDERWAQTLMRGYNKTFVFNGYIETANIIRNIATQRVSGNTNLTYSEGYVHMNYPKYKKIEWYDSAHTQKIVKTYNSFDADNVIVAFYKWREFYNGAWTAWFDCQYRYDDEYNLGPVAIDAPHAGTWVFHSPDGVQFKWRRWRNDTSVTRIQYMIGIMDSRFFGANNRTDQPATPTIDVTTTDKHSITSTNGIRW